MRLALAMTATFTALVASMSVRAAVPVNDSSILSQRSEESAKKIDIKIKLDGVKSSTQGINCAVKTPKKADNVKSPSQPADRKSGRAALERSNPDITGSSGFAAADPNAAGSGAGGTAGERTLLDGTGQVVGGMTASQGAVGPNKQVFETMGRDIGSDKTVMESFDRNSGIRLQGGLTFNEVIQATSLFAQAFNLNNINTATLQSRGSAGLVVPTPPGSGPKACPAGSSGAGTAASPCVAQGCSTTGYGTTPAPGCVARRYTDSSGNVVYMLARVQSDERAAPSTLTTDELLSAIRQYQAQ